MVVIEAIHRQLTHYAYHAGQIVVPGKIIKAGDWQSLSIEGESMKYNAELKKSQAGFAFLKLISIFTSYIIQPSH